jgi:peptide-methionine (S)-S-oxide reductase
VKRATFGAGCFWGTEHVLRSVPGVTAARVGYMGGSVPAPSYEVVCGGDTGHVEVVEVTYDPERTSYQTLLDVFWQMHDPTALYDQGPYERGPQYKAVVFYHDAEQAALATASRSALEASGVYALPIQTEIRAATTFWPADDYHQQYIARGGEHHCHVFTRTGAHVDAIADLGTAGRLFLALPRTELRAVLSVIRKMGVAKHGVGLHDEAAVLWGVAEALGRAWEAGPSHDPEVEEAVEQTRTRLGPDVFEAARARGRTMSVEEALAHALQCDAKGRPLRPDARHGEERHG